MSCSNIKKCIGLIKIKKLQTEREYQAVKYYSLVPIISLLFLFKTSYLTPYILKFLK